MIRKVAAHFWRYKWLWLCALAIAVVGEAMILPYWRPEYWSLRSQLAAAKASIRDRGEPVTFADIGAGKVQEYRASEPITRILERFANTTGEFHGVGDHTEPLSVEECQMLRDALESNRDAMDALAAVEHVEQYRFPYDFGVASPIGTLLPAVDAANRASELWAADVLLSLRNADYDRAVTAVQEQCDTAQLLMHEPFIVSQHARAGIGGYAIDDLSRVLAVADLDAEQFSALDERLAVMESTYRLADAIRAERAIVLTTMENIGHPEVRKDLGMRAGIRSSGAVFSLAPENSRINEWASFSYMLQMMRQQIWMLEQMTVAADWIDQPGTEASRRWETLNREIIDVLRSEKDSSVSELFPPISKLRNGALAYRQRLLAARLALRIVRVRAREQPFPDDLDSVLDAELSHVPCNLWDASEPKLEVRPGGFTVSYATPQVDGDLNASVSVSFPVSADTSKASPASHP